MAHVIVVGAGPAGAGLAYLLATRGVEVTLVERQSDFSREFRGEVLMPGGIAALDEMGVGVALESVPSYSPDSIEVFFNRRPVFDVRVEDGVFDGASPAAISQPGLLEMLVAEASRSPGFRLLRGASVKDLLREDERVVGLRLRRSEGEETLRGDLVVGADGRSSVVRRRSGIPVRCADPPMDIVWCKVPCPDGFDGARAYLGRGHLLVAYHTWDGQLQVGWVILKGTYGELRRRGIEDWVEEMAEHVTSDLAGHLRRQASAVQHPFLLDTQSDCVASWSAPGALLIGDAAHTMSPVGGQGINVALRDAIVAANHLVPALTGDAPSAGAIDAASRAVESERTAEVVEIQRFQALPPKVVLGTAWWSEPLRAVLAGLLRLPLVQRRAASQADLFLYGRDEVRLRV